MTNWERYFGTPDAAMRMEVRMLRDGRRFRIAVSECNPLPRACSNRAGCGTSPRGASTRTGSMPNTTTGPSNGRRTLDDELGAFLRHAGEGR